jgi:hypothetical protein
LVAVVAPFCIKGLRLVTVQLPEKFLGRRTAVIGQCEGNANFACREFSEVVASASQFCYLVPKRSGGVRVGEREV